MRCRDCKFWGDDAGTGIPYDAGYMNYCKHISIDGQQHPSYGACGDAPTMVYIGGDSHQNVMTRATFGCILFEQRKITK